jgi:hypothetical protein
MRATHVTHERVLMRIDAAKAVINAVPAIEDKRLLQPPENNVLYEAAIAAHAGAARHALVSAVIFITDDEEYDIPLIVTALRSCDDVEVLAAFKTLRYLTGDAPDDDEEPLTVRLESLKNPVFFLPETCIFNFRKH